MNYNVTKDGTITSVINGRAYTVRRDHPHYMAIKATLVSKDEERFVVLADTVSEMKSKLDKANVNRVGDKVTICNKAVYYGSQEVHNTLTERIVELLSAGFPIDSMCRFLENLMDNPSARAVNELYEFLMHRSLPITDDGCFLAYKSVTHDFKDKWTGKIDNSIGREVSMPRNQVDDDAAKTCSVGLHCGALEYAGPGGWYNNSNDKCIIVKVNPRDAVTVPLDHNAEKLRICRYEVMSEYNGKLNRPVYQTTDELKTDDGYTPYNSHEEAFEDNGEFDEDVYVEDLNYGDYVTFDYEGKTRHCSVEEMFDTNMTCLLIDPETNAGQYRTFTYNKISNLQYV